MHYALIEVVPERGEAGSIERGLFKGVNKLVNGRAFLCVISDRNIAKTYSLDFYNVLSIETYDGLTRNLTFFQKGEDEQKKAQEALAELFASLRALVSEEDDCVIDVTKYKEVPTDFGTSSSKRIIEGNSASSSSYTSMQDYYNKTNKSSSSAVYNPGFQKKDPEPMAFRRRTKKPTEDILNELGAKLDLIAKGEYECEFPKVRGEEKGEKTEKAVDKTPLSDEWDDYPFYT